MKHAFTLLWFFLLAACAAAPGDISPEAKSAPVWRYAVRADAQGKRRAFAVDTNSPAEIALPDGLWCPHGALIDLERNWAGKVVGAVSKEEPMRLAFPMAGATVQQAAHCLPPYAVDEVTGQSLNWVVAGDMLPAFALAPASGQKQPWVVLRCQPLENQTNWAILERRPEWTRVTEMGPWQIEHIQFQRMERPGPGLENCVLLTFQAGEGSQDAVVKVEIGRYGARLRPRTEQDVAILRHFLGRATPAEKAVVEKILGQWQEQPEWSRFFEEAGVVGTIAVADERTGRQLTCNAQRSAARFIPASTFKIPHTLFALDAGLVKDEFQVFAWDGVQREVPAWNRDQTLRSAMRASTVWVYQGFARQLGEAKEKEYLAGIGYGNADPSGGVDHFWLDGGLRISAVEQIAFLQRLHRDQLPFSAAHQRLVKDLMVVEAGRDWTLRAKSGWASQVGWYVGWVEKPEGAVFFALNIDMKEIKDAPKREGIVRGVLREMGVLEGK